MSIVDLVIAAIVVASAWLGFTRGLVKEAVSIAALLVAIWAALNFGAEVGGMSEDWLNGDELQMWFGRIVVFVIVIALGGLLGWGLSKLVGLSMLSVTDKAFGVVFGFFRGVVLVAVCVMAGQFTNLHFEAWWQDALLMPYMEQAADWIRVMAPKGVEMLQPENMPDPDEFSDFL